MGTSSWVSSQISLNFHFDAFAIDAGGFTNRSEIKMDKSFMEHSKSYLFYEGGLPALQTSQSLAQWEPTIAQAPHFLNATLDKISNLAADPQVQTALRSESLSSPMLMAQSPTQLARSARRPSKAL